MRLTDVMLFELLHAAIWGPQAESDAERLEAEFHEDEVELPERLRDPFRALDEARRRLESW